MQEGTTSRVTAADRPYGKFYDFYSVGLENFGSTLVNVYTLSFIILDIVGGKPSSFVTKCSLPPTTFLSLSYGDYVTLPEAQLQMYVTCYNFFSKLSQHNVPYQH